MNFLLWMLLRIAGYCISGPHGFTHAYISNVSKLTNRAQVPTHLGCPLVRMIVERLLRWVLRDLIQM